MKLQKKMFLMILCFYFFNSYLAANANSKEEWPVIFSKEKVLVVVRESRTYQGHIVYDQIISRIDDEDMVNSNWLTNEVKYTLMMWFKEGYGEARYDKKIAGLLMKSIKDIAWKVQEKIDNCQFLQDLYKEQIEGKGGLGISFQPGPGCGSTLGKSAMVDLGLLRLILKDIGEQLKNGDEEIEVNPSKYTCGGNDIVTIMGHETLHAITGAGEPANVDECLIHCLTKNYLAENANDYIIKNMAINNGGNLKCNEITEEQWDWVMERTGDVDPREEMEAGDCFCGEKWTEDADCDENKPNPVPPPTGGNGGGGSGGSRPRDYEHSDNGDENFSWASAQLAFVNAAYPIEKFPLPPGIDFLSLGYYPDLLIYNKFDYPDLPRLLDRFNGFSYIHDYNHDYFSNNHKVLVIPSGELMGDSGSAILKQSLKNFVDNGGVILCLAQQYDTDWQLLPGSGDEILSGPGWRQDQECMIGSCYYDQMTAPLTSLAAAGNWESGYSISTDGYFNRFPQNSTILLKRTKNGYPLALYYPGANNRSVLISPKIAHPG
jgi:hypothetical protein